jgi:hypothetical protein
VELTYRLWKRIRYVLNGDENGEKAANPNPNVHYNEILAR